jgi:hypothetical protein
MAKQRTDWGAAMEDYVRDATATYETVAARHGVSVRSLEWHAQREQWRSARAEYAWKVREKSVAECTTDAAILLRQRNAEQLQQNEELRRLLCRLLMYRYPDGRIAINGDLSLGEICRGIDGLSALYHCDRLILGADDMPHPMPRDRFAEMTDEELHAELQRVRAANFASATDEELEELGLKRAKPTLQ